MSFLPLAEETGSIVALTEWVLAAACKDGRSLRDKGLPCIPVAVNISPHYFRRDNFVGRMEAVLESSSLDPAGLQIEITEGVFLDSQPMPFADLVTSLLHNEGQYLLPSAGDNTAVCSEHDSSNTCS